jgi:hypothetical protein
MASGARAKTEQAVLQVLQHPVDWLLAVIVSWLIPLEFFGRPSSYFSSLWFWLVPIVLLLPRLYAETDAGGRRRRAFWYTAGFVLLAGIALDFILGAWILRFDELTKYVATIGPIPIEEVLFYMLGGMAIVLVYIWADEYWMRAYNVRRRRWNDELFGESFALLEFSPHVVALGLILFVAGVGLRRYFTGEWWPPPYYFTFLIGIAIVPAILVYRNVKEVVNWRAFSFTCLYVLVTSCIWEVTLGIPRKWWWYKEPPAVIGWYIDAFGTLPDRPYPIEALIVWLAICFDTVFAYEFLKGVAYERRPNRMLK